MENDPLYIKIVERLNGHLDDQIFQTCAGDLLGKIYPGLVPYIGGDDAGMDGAISESDNEPYPLVITTSEDAIGNFTRNLEKYKSEGGKQRKAVFATSKPLTPRKSRNLSKRAEELGFILIQAYSQDWFARALYRSPDWCLSLLGLSGRPSALSKIPMTLRPLLDIPLVGRELDLDWLTSSIKDRLLIGQPGCGKTFLLNKFVQDGRGLFLVSDDLQEIANAIRSEQPNNIIMDDVHLHEDLLNAIIHLRSEIHADFGIIASCWTGEKEQISQVLQIGDSSIHQLDPLSRSEIVSVIQEAGIIGPEQLIREIVDQSEGKPGLAVTLVQVCYSSSPKDIYLGDAISRSIKNYFSPILGKEIITILGAFSIGGDIGIPKRAISEVLGINLMELWKYVTLLAAGGVIWDAGNDNLVVYPVALRYALVRDVFFSGYGLPSDIIQSLQKKCPSQIKTVSVLIGAKRSGAKIEKSVLLQQLIELDSIELWEQYAALGKEETCWILDQYPEKASRIASYGLYFSPHKIIPLLFSSAVNDKRPLNSATDHPLRIIQDWIQSSEPGTDDAIAYRIILLDEIIIWLEGGGDQQIGLQAIRNVFSPRFESISSSPGNENTITWRTGCLTNNEIIQLCPQWDRVYELLKKTRIDDWKMVFEMLNDWVYPWWINGKITPETKQLIRNFGVKILIEIIPLLKDKPAYLRQARQIVKELHIEINIPNNPEFDVLYPLEDIKDRSLSDLRNKKQADKLAKLWSKLDPPRIAFKISTYEKEAFTAQLSYPHWTPYICIKIAEYTKYPIHWVKAGIEADLSGDLVIPFLRKVVEINDPEWIPLAAECLNRPFCMESTIAMILTLHSPPWHLLDNVLGILNNIPNYKDLVETICIRREVPLSTMQLLLKHDNPQIASAAAEGEWLAEPQGNVRDELFDDWHNIVINKTPSGYWLSEVFKKDTTIAFEWLLTHIEKLTWMEISGENNNAQVAIQSIGSKEKRILLNRIPSDIHYTILVKDLVDNDPDLFQALLEIKELEPLYLAPLYGNPNNEIWIQLAKKALDKGYSSEEIAYAAIFGVGMNGISWSGNESSMWQEWMDRFNYLVENDDKRINNIGRDGRKYAESRKKEALEEEHHEEIFGFNDKRRRLSK